MPRNRRPNFPVPIVHSDDDTDIESVSNASSDHLKNNIKSFAPRNKVFDRRGVYVPKVNDTWAMDLIDMSKSEAGYILNVVDIYSRKAESVKIMQKSSEKIKQALEEIFERFGATPQKIWTDKESAFYGLKEWFKEKGIYLYSLNNSYMGPNTHSVPIVERFNRSMKAYMMKLKGDKQVIGKSFNQLMARTVREFIPLYNKKIHTTLKATPNDVYNGVKQVKKIHLRNVNRPRVSLKPFKVGDKVLLQKNFKNPIRNKTETTYYEYPYKIIQVKLTNPITYVLDDIEGTFYRNQLKLVE